MNAKRLRSPMRRRFNVADYARIRAMLISKGILQFPRSIATEVSPKSGRGIRVLQAGFSPFVFPPLKKKKKKKTKNSRLWGLQMCSSEWESLAIFQK